jgi:tetratricopeptide (TPR) repeat protein
MKMDIHENELKRPDEFETFFGRLLSKLIENGKMVLVFLIGIALAAIGTVKWQASRLDKDRQEAQKLEVLLKDYPSEKADRSAWESFGKKIGEFISAHPNNSMIPGASLYQAKSWMMIGKYDEAIKLYQQAAQKLPKPYQYLAREGEALALMEQEKWSEAERIWSELIGYSDNPTKAFHAWNLGLSQEGGNKKTEALKTFGEFETKYSDSPFMEQVRQRLAILRQSS